MKLLKILNNILCYILEINGVFLIIETSIINYYDFEKFLITFTLGLISILFGIKNIKEIK